MKTVEISHYGAEPEAQLPRMEVSVNATRPNHVKGPRVVVQRFNGPEELPKNGREVRIVINQLKSDLECNKDCEDNGGKTTDMDWSNSGNDRIRASGGESDSDSDSDGGAPLHPPRAQHDHNKEDNDGGAISGGGAMLGGDSIGSETEDKLGFSF